MRNCPQCGAESASIHRFCPACGFPVGALKGGGGDPLIGRTLGGAYVVLENVGSGGMGKVYRAEQKSLGKTVAVKVIHPHLIADESATARFYTEARAASKLNHPNSVSVLEFGRTDDGLLYLVMEFLRGKDLAHVLWEEGPLPAVRAADVLAQVLAALSEAHEMSIIHRDIKPENVLVEKLRTGADFVKVVDFGLAKVRADVAPSVTMPGIVCGTPDYMAPEQGRGDPLDARSDLYSCGVLLFQVLTGRLPFEAESPTQMVLMHIGTPPPDPRTFMPGIPEAMVQIVFRALEKDQRARYQSAVEFATALREFIRDEQARKRKRQAASGAMLACPSCGAQNRSGVKFCNECGSRIVGAPAVAEATSDGAAATTLDALPAQGEPVGHDRVSSVPPADTWDEPTLHGMPGPDDALRAALAFATESNGMVEAVELLPDASGDEAPRGMGALVSSPPASPVSGARPSVRPPPTVSISPVPPSAPGPASMGTVSDAARRKFNKTQAFSSFSVLNDDAHDSVAPSDAPPSGTSEAVRDAMSPRAESGAPRMHVPEGSGPVRADSVALRAVGLAARPAPMHVQGRPSGETAMTPRDGAIKALPFVGRADELAQLEALRARSIAAGNLFALRVAGDLGVGKHRLVTEFLQRARSLGDRAVVAEVDSSWAGVAYATIASAIRAALGLSQGDDAIAWLEKAGATDPAAARRDVRAGFEEVFGKGAVHLDGRGRREAVLRALSFSLTRLSREAPGAAVIAVFEQLERADPASLKVLAALASYPLAAPVLLVATHVPRVDPGWSSGSMLVLRGLLRDEALALLLGATDVSVTDARAALEPVEDPVSPMYVEQLARWLAEGGGTPPLRTVDLLAARFERLAPKARRSLQALALLGEAGPETLARVLSERIDVSTIELLRVRGWLSSREQKGQVVLSVAHPLAREVSESSLSAAMRAELHQRCAAELADESAPIELRALHATYASDAFQALFLLERVGDRALARGDDLGAALALRRGLERARRELHRGEIDDPERAIAIFARKLGEALVREGEVAEAEGVLREAMELVSRGSAEWARLMGVLARAMRARGRTSEAMRQLDEALKAARRATAHELVADLLSLRAELDRSVGNAADAVTHLRGADEAIRDAVRTMSLGAGRRTAGAFDDSALSRLRLEVLIRLAGALREASRDEEATPFIEDARQLAERLRLPGELARVEAEAGENAERLGDRSEALAAWRRAREAAAEAGNVLAEAQYRDREGRLRDGEAAAGEVAS